MLLHTIDWIFIFGFFGLALAIGALVTKRAGQSSSEFFLSKRGMPWWLLGFSMVATTFSTDTPNLVTNIVRTNGIAGNWVWWAFLITGMLTVFVYARMWRRLGVLTDLEFYEIRYSGRMAAFLRGFRALYLGVFFNIMIMATVSLAAIKIGGVMLGLAPHHCIIWSLIVTVIFCSLGGFRGVIWTDFILFVLAMVGAFAAAHTALSHPAVDGLGGLLDKLSDPQNPTLAEKLRFVPSFDFSTPQTTNLVVSVFIIPLAVQWWSVWYPGAEPGGGGYLAQRMLAARNEDHAQRAVLFFNVAHYALRPWPWIIVAVCSLIVFPDLLSIEQAFPDADKGIVGHDIAYPAMLTFLGPGWLGLVLTSLIAAYMSTISTHLNWGASYLVNDWYKRFVKPQASERELVWAGRLALGVMIVIVALLALAFKDALEWFNVLLQIGAGTGLIFILRWFWWRINPISELTAMVVSFLIALGFFIQHKLINSAQAALVESGLDATAAYQQAVERYHGWEGWQELLFGVVITTICWVTVTLLTKPSDKSKLLAFIQRINPGGPGWKPIIEEAKIRGLDLPQQNREDALPLGILRMVLGCTAVYATLFATGFWLFDNPLPATVLTIVAIVAASVLIIRWRRIGVPTP